ncbi:MAG: hypothetical protein U0931_33210 [Vulcanimicrobiota bacterium]
MERYGTPLVELEREGIYSRVIEYELDPLDRPLAIPHIGLHLFAPYTPREVRQDLESLFDFSNALRFTPKISLAVNSDEFSVMALVESPEEVEPTLALCLERLFWFIDAYNEAARRANFLLRQQLTELVEKRWERTAALQNSVVKASQKLRIKLKRSASNLVDLEVRREIAVLREPSNAAGPELSGESFRLVLEELKRLARHFEVAPGAYAKLDEPDFRHIVLATLNTIFHAEGTAETFSSQGKTDIHLAVPGASHVLVAECKVWKGPKKLKGALAQLHGYLQWRHSYGVLLYFQRTGSVSRTVTESFDVLNGLAAFPERGAKLDERHHYTVHRHPVDPEKEVDVHTIFINLTSSAPKSMTQ